MSKKLIAVASATALALSALVGVAPASATAFAVTVNGEVAGTGSDATTNALTVEVPTQDLIRKSANASAAFNSAIEFDVTATTSTGAVTATATGGVKLLNATQLADADTTSKSGAQSLTVAAVANNAKIYAFTTSTTAGTVTISNGGNTTTYFLRGLSTKGYKLTLNAASAATKGVDYKFTASVVDMFGNPTSGLAIANFVMTGLGAFASDADGNATETESATTKGTYTITIPGSDVSSSGAGLATVVLTTAVYTENEDAFGKTDVTKTLSVNSVDPTTQITALTAQVAALTAQLAASRPMATSVTKKKYNTLARKWNAANPGARVALKK
jgi:hypothetical protein